MITSHVRRIFVRLLCEWTLHEDIWIFHLDANSYLLIGVPLVVLFQRFVRRQLLRQLWVRDAAAFRLGVVGSVIALLLILAPGYDLIFVAVPKKSWIVALWFLCAMAGAVFAAFAITQQRAGATRRALLSFISAVLIGMAIMAAIALQGTTASVCRFQSCLCCSSSSYSTLWSLSCSRRLRFAAL